MIELLPCPFCNGKADVCDGEIEHYNNGSVLIFYSVFCHTDTCFLREGSETDYSSKEDAIKAWNTRFDK